MLCFFCFPVPIWGNWVENWILIRSMYSFARKYIFAFYSGISFTGKWIGMYSVERKNILALTRWTSTKVSCKSDQFPFKIAGKSEYVGKWWPFYGYSCCFLTLCKNNVLKLVTFYHSYNCQPFRITELFLCMLRKCDLPHINSTTKYLIMLVMCCNS